MKRGLFVIIDQVNWHRDYVSRVARSRGFQTISFTSQEEYDQAMNGRKPDLFFSAGETHVLFIDKNEKISYFPKPLTAVDLDHICWERNL